MSDVTAASSAAAIDVWVNGELRRLASGTTVIGLVESLGLQPGQVAVERNGEVVPRRTHAEVTLQPGDRLEVVTFVGGG